MDFHEDIGPGLFQLLQKLIQRRGLSTVIVLIVVYKILVHLCPFPSFLVVALDCGWRGSGGGIVDRPSGTGSLIKAELFATLLPRDSALLCFYASR